MKTASVLLAFSVLFLTALNSFAQQIINHQAMLVTEQIIKTNNKSSDYSVKNIQPVYDNTEISFYLAELAPKGYVIISPDETLPPVIAYSFENNADLQSNITDFFKYDIKTRLAAVKKLPEYVIIKRKAVWQKMLSQNFYRETQLESWPPAGSTTTGGWMEFSWNQTAPYSNMCPIDPVTSGRSYTGCPATAMGMILNFHKTTNNTQFTDDDDYYHNYANRTFHIDDDYAANGFPSFPDLNKYLDTINMHWQNNEAITNNDKAALSFACGVAATQVFTSEGSGTFAVSQAYDAYQRFGCTTSILYYPGNEDLFPVLIQNMKDTLPAHLAIENEAANSGHNIVLDGYNSDNYFHANFGWGGTYNGWYLVPDEMPYSLTVIEGVIVNIMKDENTKVQNLNSGYEISVYPNPSSTEIRVAVPENLLNKNINLIMYNSAGQVIFESHVDRNDITINTSGLGLKGVYFIKLVSSENTEIKTQKIIFE